MMAQESPGDEKAAYRRFNRITHCFFGMARSVLGIRI